MLITRPSNHSVQLSSQRLVGVQGRGGLSAQRRFRRQFRLQRKDWLEDYALFMALKDALAVSALADWPSELHRSQPSRPANRPARRLKPRSTCTNSGSSYFSASGGSCASTPACEGSG